MSIFHSVLLCGALILAGTVAKAQQPIPSEAATAEQRLVEDLGAERISTAIQPSVLGDARNKSSLLQNGVSNTATIDQQSLSTLGNQAYIEQAGALNVLGLVQTGGGNQAYMTQQGLGNRTDFTQQGQGNLSTVTQRGANNRLQGLVDGNNNELNIQQDGVNNRVQSEIRQNDRTYSISQIGYGNILTQKETTTQSPQGYSVEMRGVGINVTIEQGRVSR